MKLTIYVILFFIATAFSCNPSNEGSKNTPTPESDETGYDAGLATKLGADQYGMRQYVFAYLKKGPNRNLSKEESDKLQRAHLDNITRLAEEGKLVLAGPFLDDTDIRGIYIFAVDSLEEAEKIANSDPAIQAGSLTLELHPWYGSAALMKVNEMHVRVAKEGI